MQWKESGPRTFHTLPQRAPLRDQWVDQCGLKVEVYSLKKVTVCSGHFHKQDFKVTPKRKCLIQGAIPTLFLPKQLEEVVEVSTTESTFPAEPLQQQLEDPVTVVTTVEEEVAELPISPSDTSDGAPLPQLDEAVELPIPSSDSTSDAAKTSLGEGSSGFTTSEPVKPEKATQATDSSPDYGKIVA